MKATKSMEKEEILELIKDYQDNKSTSARDKLLLQFYPYFEYLTSKYSLDYDYKEDLRQEAIFDFLYFIETYDGKDSEYLHNKIKRYVNKKMGKNLYKIKDITNTYDWRQTLEERKEYFEINSWLLAKRDIPILSQLIINEKLQLIQEHMVKKKYNLQFFFYNKFINGIGAKETANFLNCDEGNLLLNLRNFIKEIKELD